MTSSIDTLKITDKKRYRNAAIFLALLLVAGLITTGGIAFVGLLLLTGTSATALINSLLGITDKTAWQLSRSAGTVAYLLLAGSTVWGLLQSSKIAKEVIPSGLSFAMHNILSWLALAFTGFHALVLLFDNFYTYTLADLTIPFIGPYRPLWVGLGILGTYMMVVILISYQFRRQIGQHRWRALHYLSFVLYVLATAHGLAAGTDSSKSGMQLMYLGSGLLIFFLTTYWLLTNRAGSSRSARRIA